MDSSAPKRRKTSPTASVPVESTTPPDPPPGQPSQDSRQPQVSPSRSPQRPSFASPTRPSLARHNPEVLTRRRAVTSPRQGDLPASQAGSQDEDADVTAALTAQFEHHSEGDGTGSSSPVAVGSGPQGPAAAAAQSSPAGPVEDAPRSPSRPVGGKTLGAQPPRRTPTRPQPRPLPPPGPENEEDITMSLPRRSSRRSPTNTGVLPAVVHEEPRLPPTPEHPDPVVSTPPSGIHHTPSKRRRDASEKEAARQQSSPSKHPLSQEVALGQPPRKEPDSFKARRRGSPAKTTVASAPLPEKPVEADVRPRSDFVPGTHPRRSIRLRGPDWEKKQERDALLREVEQLEADLELARGENDNAAMGLPLAAGKDAVLDLLRRHVLPAGKGPDLDQGPDWLEVTMNPMAMLGFNGSRSILLPPAVPQETGQDGDQQPPVSHHPTPMNASEELPYLQVFSPLTYTSTVATVPPSAEQPDQPTTQKHTITIRSASPAGLFSARLEMTVNTRTLAVSSLSVPRLNPAAAPELSPFIDRASSSQPKVPYHPGLTRNPSIVCWAMAEWYRVALRRAKFWRALEKQLGDKNGIAEAVLATRARKKRRRRRQQQQQKDAAADGDSGVGDSFPSAEGLGGLDSMAPSKGELLPHMGRTSMDFEVPYLAGGDGEVSGLRASWAIEFDWTGEANSKLGVEVGVLSKWQAADDRKSIVGIPKLFDKLVRGGEDPLMAVRTVVALLAGEPEA